MSIIINGHIRTTAENVQDLYADLQAGIPRTLLEDGCLFYAFAIDDPQSASILVAERWRDQASLDAHLATPEIAELMGKWTGRMEPDVRLFDASNERGFGE